MMKVVLCLLMAGALGLSGNEDIPEFSYMPLVYNFYDMIAQAGCMSRIAKPTTAWAVRKSCSSTKSCYEICSLNRLGCYYALAVHKTPKILHADNNQDEGINGLSTNLYSEYEGCPLRGCGPNYCCCEGDANI